MRRPLLAFIGVAIPDLHASASGCMRAVEAQISFTPGARCWRYEGKATSFVGSFGSGQRVTVEMAGVADFSENGGRVTRTEWQPRSPSVAGPRGFSASDMEASGSLSFQTRASGRYDFSFSPCAMWGGFGRVTICAD